MPPVRWKLLTAFSIFCLSCLQLTSSAKQGSFSFADEGWRPILGNGGARDKSVQDEITQYRNPASKKAETVKVEKNNIPNKNNYKPKLENVKPTFSTTTTTTKTNSINNNNNNNQQNLGQKMPLHTKPMILVPAHGGHGPQIPVGAAMHRATPLKYGHLIKMHPHKRPMPNKPIRILPSYSSRDEVFVPAPSSNIGPYTFFSAVQPPIKNRGPQNLFDFNHQHQQHQHHHNQHSGQDEFYQLIRAPVQQYVVPKPLHNDIHYNVQNQHDDFTRNLVPPIPPAHKEKPLKPFKHELEPTKPSPQQSIPIQTQYFPQKQQNQHYQNNKDKPVEVQITKEKLKVYHNAIPQNYRPQEELEFHLFKNQQNNQQTGVPYEVTEGKPWQESFPQHLSTRIPPQQRRPALVFDEIQPFLPTPIKPDVAPPTIPTESEVSTIYNQVALNKHKEYSDNSGYFSIKEVSTHFPIFGQPDTYESSNQRFEPELTTPAQITEIETTTTTSRPTQRNKRPNLRRRRPSSKTTTEEPEVTEIYEAQKSASSSEESAERPHRRRPVKYRTTTQSSEDEIVTRPRYRRPRPTSSEQETPSNHRTVYVEPTLEAFKEKKLISKMTTEKDFPANFESQFISEIKKTSSQENDEYYEQPMRKFVRPYDKERPNKYSNMPERMDDDNDDEIESSTRVTDIFASLNMFTPENEIDYTTKALTTAVPFIRDETTTEFMISTTPTTTTSTTTTTTTTTPAPTTSATTTTTENNKVHRIRTRPHKYDNNNRPRFSVKEYRQRLSSSTSTTEAPKVSTTGEILRNRFPIRNRRPIQNDEENNTEAIRSKFTPKDPRHGSSDIISTTEKPFKPINTRLRPFGRVKTTTEPTSTTTKTSFKPNIFNNLRRPTPISLKNRIYGKNKVTTKPPEMDSDETNDTEMSEIVESTLPYNTEMTTEFGAKVIVENENPGLKSSFDISSKSDDFMQSQIVSDLTSSTKNEYDKPGMFKNVVPNSRKVPSYFTLATEDPILPIEAFFPNLKQ